MFERKIDLDQLQILLDRKMTQAEIARKLGVNPSSITKAVRRLKGIPQFNRHSTKVVAMEKAKRYADHQFNVMAQQEKNVGILNELLNALMDYIWGNNNAFKAMQRRVETDSIEEGGEGKKEKKGGNDGTKAVKGNGKKTKIEKKIETFDFTTDPKLLAIQVIREIREHMEFQLEIFKTVANAENVMAFQKHVIAILGEISPDARERFIARLRSEHAIRAALILD